MDLQTRPFKLCVQEPHVEGRVVNHQLRVLDEVEKRLRDRREDGLVGQERFADPVDVECLFGHGRSGLMYW
jgi:hypothetical protein